MNDCFAFQWQKRGLYSAFRRSLISQRSVWVPNSQLFCFDFIDFFIVVFLKTFFFTPHFRRRTKKMGKGIVLVNWHNNKLFVFVSILLVCLLACFLVGGLVGMIAANSFLRTLFAIILQTRQIVIQLFIFIFVCSTKTVYRR